MHLRVFTPQVELFISFRQQYGHIKRRNQYFLNPRNDNHYEDCMSKACTCVSNIETVTSVTMD